MSVSKLPSGRWRAQVYDPASGKNVSVSHVLGGPGTFATKTEAKQARTKARERLGQSALEGRDASGGSGSAGRPIRCSRGPKESSDIRRRELTKAFVERYGDVPIDQVGDEIVAEWLAGGARSGTVQGLRSMFNDAASMKAGRLIDRNPFAKLGISRGHGQARPAAAERGAGVGDHRVTRARLSGPSFAAWLQVAAFTGLRPGELDALRWERIDFDRDRIVVAEQFNAATRRFDTPKNHLRREAPLTAHARAALLGAAA